MPLQVLNFVRSGAPSTVIPFLDDPVMFRDDETLSSWSLNSWSQKGMAFASQNLPDRGNFPTLTACAQVGETVRGRHPHAPRG